MAEKIGFTSRKQFLDALRAQFETRRRRRPIIKLSSEALTASLPEGWLRDTRDFLTRTGEWAEHPIKSAEHFVSVPAIGVVVDASMPKVIGNIREPLFASLGFGDVTYAEEARCGKNTCDDQDLRNGGDNGGHSCQVNKCGEQWCDKHGCDTQECDDQTCGEATCREQTSIVEFASEVEANRDHPFVRDLRNHFQVGSIDALTSAVHEFVCMNGFDESLVR